VPPARPLDLTPGARPRLPPCFSRRANSPTAARLTPKALRLYAEQGLLPPAEVDRHLRARRPGPPRPVRRAAAGVLRRPGHARPRRRRRGGGAVLGPGRTDRRPARPLGAAHTAAWLPVPPDHEDLPLILRVYDAVESWIDHHPGLRICGHPYETAPGTGASFDVSYPVMEVNTVPHRLRRRHTRNRDIEVGLLSGTSPAGRGSRR
jgi:hypothetical protein